MQIHRIAFTAMACGCEVVLAVDSAVDSATGRADEAAALAQHGIDEVLRIERTYSRYLDDSIVARINAAAGGQAVLCDAETWALLEYADQLHRASDGLFDITSGVLRRAWNFKQPRVPDAGELAALRALIAWPSVERHDMRVRLPQRGMEIDFGGFGKEYAADRAGALLAARGVRHGYVNLGGDMRVLGPKPDGTPWLIGIQHPRKVNALIATLPVQQGGLATSGDYERFFELDGARYCHVLDPRSGMPVTHWRSVSVLAPLAVVAGNCTTMAMLKGPAGLAWLQASGMDFLAIDQQGHVHTRDTVVPAALADEADATLTAQGA